MRRFLPAGGGGEPSSSSSSGPHGERVGSQAAAGLPYGGGDISQGRGHDRHSQFHSGDGGGGGGGEAEMKDGVDMLARHSSSPAGFFSNLMAAGNGFPGSKAGAAGGGGAEAHHHHHSMANNNTNSRKMKCSQLSFTAGPQGDAHLSQISEDGGAGLFPGADRAAGHPGENSVPRSFSAGGGGGGGFSIAGPWDEFSGMASLSTLEMAGVDRYMQLQQDQVPFKVRAKRGCATHPRSIAERERRTRISEKLRKLQELVPNMDKQTSTSDMLDLAVEHIKGLQSQLQTMKHEQEKCTCCSKP